MKKSIKNGNLKSVMGIILSVLIVMGSISIPVFYSFAEGSRSISSRADANAYRAYTEYGEPNFKTATIRRMQVMKTYMKKGETAYFGSSVYNSELDENHVWVKTVTGVDITVTSPEGVTKGFDVIGFDKPKEERIGFIENTTQEKAGPALTEDSKGYKPLSFVAESDGIYIFNFHSKTSMPYTRKSNGQYNDGTNGTSRVGANPKYVPITTDTFGENNSYQGDGYISAWDITVYNNGVEKPGRTFTNLVSLNMGANTKKYLSATFYVLTNDSYIYKTTFTDMDPWGFLFFSNNRGYVDVDTDTIAYRSFHSTDNQITDLTSKGRLAIHNPNAPDTEEDHTYKIFFERPDPELDEEFFGYAYEPEHIENLRFVGAVGPSTTLVNHGGRFLFDTKNASAATLTIDMSALRHYDEETDEWVIEDRGIVSITNAVEDGENCFNWDGKDGHGNYLEAGSYDNNSIKISAVPHAGEYHFPLIDVENNENGIKIERVNNIYKAEKDADGNILRDENDKVVKTDVTDKYTSSAHTLHYNNNNVYGDERGYNAAATNRLNKEGVIVPIADGLDCSKGVDSSKGVMKYGPVSGVDPQYGPGNQCVVDCWSYAIGETTTLSLDKPLKIVDSNEQHVTAVSGRVFYDENKDGRFDLNDNSFYLHNVEVKIEYVRHTYNNITGVYDEEIITETTKTDMSGYYEFDNIPFDTEHSGHPHYATVTITNPNDDFIVTTEGQLVQEGLILGDPEKGNALDVGLHFDPKVIDIEISKNWASDESEDIFRPTRLIVDVEGGYEEFTETGNIWVETYSNSVELNEDNNWKVVLDDVPTKAEVSGKIHEVTYRIVDELFNDNVENGLTWSYEIHGDDAAYPYETTIENVVNPVTKNIKSTITNTSKNYWQLIDKQPTCTEDGEKTYVCTTDPNHKYVIEERPATGHDYDDGIITKQPTCEEDGEKTFTCQNNPDHNYTETIPAHGHKWNNGGILKEPTCTEEGEKVYTCPECEHIRIEKIPKLDHEDSNGDGVCDNCGTSNIKGKERYPVIFFAPDNVSYKLADGIKYYTSASGSFPRTSANTSFHDSTTIYVEKGTVIKFQSRTFFESYGNGYVVTLKQSGSEKILPEIIDSDNNGYFSFTVTSGGSFVSMQPVIVNKDTNEKTPWYQFLLDFFAKIKEFFQNLFS